LAPRTAAPVELEVECELDDVRVELPVAVRVLEPVEEVPERDTDGAFAYNEALVKVVHCEVAGMRGS